MSAGCGSPTTAISYPAVNKTAFFAASRNILLFSFCPSPSTTTNRSPTTRARRTTPASRSTTSSRRRRSCRSAKTRCRSPWKWRRSTTRSWRWSISTAAAALTMRATTTTPTTARATAPSRVPAMSRASRSIASATDNCTPRQKWNESPSAAVRTTAVALQRPTPLSPSARCPPPPATPLSRVRTGQRDEEFCKAQTLPAPPRRVARFQDLVGHNAFLGGQDFCFYYMFETNFSGRNKIWDGTKEILGALPPNASPRGYGSELPSL